MWLNRHGAPRMVSADDELDATDKKKLGSFLQLHDISLKPRPVGRHKKLGIAERKRVNLKNILERLK